MSDKKASYKETLKNTTIFGGVQIINVLISVIRGKFISVLLGPVGMGITSLLNSPLMLIGTITGMGLRLSAVREISEAYKTDDQIKIARVVTIARKLFFLLGILGSGVTLAMAPLLSHLSFGNQEYTWAFVWLSITIFLATMSEGQNTLLRSFRKISHIVKSGLIGSVLGLITSIPLYYFYGVKGIIPAMILSALSLCILTWYYERKIVVEDVKISFKEMYIEGFDMVKMGLMLVIAIFLGHLCQFGINISIGYFGNISDVGFYAAATAISAQYIGFILISLSVDYFPRLAAVNKDILKTNKVVNEQMEIVLLLAAPLLILMILTSSILIRVLLTPEFLVITDFIRYVAIGSFFQAASFSIGYISFAKNDKYVYLLLEGGFSNLLKFVFSVTFYYYWGLKGLGFSFLAIYFTYFIVINVFTYKRYKFRLTKNTIKLFLITLILLVTSLLVVTLSTKTYGYIFGGVILVGSAYYSYLELDKLMDLKEIILRLFSKIVKKNRNKGE
tara:strand:+ start:1318 stop:2829 length:1512 start_codon:yes stop_codon:yes gene_type:complete